MGVFDLESIGRSNMPQALGTVLNDLRSRRQQETMNRRTDLMETQEARLQESTGLQNQLTQQQINLGRIGLKKQQDEQARLSERVDVQVLMDKLGPNKKLTKFMHDVAMNAGYIDIKTGTMSQGDLERVRNVDLIKPHNAIKVSGLAIEDARDHYNLLKSFEDPNNPDAKDGMKKLGIKNEAELKTHMDNAIGRLRSAQGRDDGLQKYFAQQADTKRAEAAKTRANRENRPAGGSLTYYGEMEDGTPIEFKAMDGEAPPEQPGMVGGWSRVKRGGLTQGYVSDEQVRATARGIEDGLDARSQLPKRGNVRARATARIYETYPKFNFGMSEANWNTATDQTLIRSAKLVTALLPRFDELYGKAVAIKNATGLPVLDQPISQIRKALGSAAVTGYDSLRNAVIQEAGVALTGSSVVSDHRINLELENLQAGMTLGQQLESISNLKHALQARREVATLKAYPLEVVRGLKTVKAWKKGLDDEARQLRGKKYETGGAQPKEVTTQAQFDALESGDTYLENGKPYRKP